MPDHSFFGLSPNDITAISALASGVIAIVALFLTIINLTLIRRIKIVDSMRWVGEKFTELNILELEKDENIRLNFFNISDHELSEAEIKKAKRESIAFNYLNILSAVYIEMKYKTLKRSHATKILEAFIPRIVRDEVAKTCLETGGYEDDFVEFCLKTADRLSRNA